jgi:hypothetical protein
MLNFSLPTYSDKLKAYFLVLRSFHVDVAVLAVFFHFIAQNAESRPLEKTKKSF